MGSLRALAFAMDLAITAAPLVAGLVAASLTAAPALAAGLADVPFWIGAGQQSQSHLGYSVAPAGDVNGDGYSDVLAGARSFDNGQVNEGRAVVWLGGPAGPTASPDWSAESNQALAFAGASVASGGDVNGDGYDDVLVGTSSYDGALQNEGRAQLFLGSAAGLDTAAVWTVDGGQAGAAYGICVAFAGDVNGDGYDDVLVGARGWDGAQANAGRVFLYLGAPAGPATTAAWTADGTEEDAGFGYSVAGAGDVDADGYADVVVGAFWQNGAFVDQGAAFVWRGAPTLPAASPDWTLTGTQQLESFGWSVAPAGDVDGDGYADVIVGSRHYDGVAGIDAGRARLFRGGASGLATTAAWTAESPRAGALFGWSVAPAGDVDGDGYADVVIGAYKDDVQYLDDGSAFLYLGGPAGLGAAPAWVGTRGETNSAYGWSVAGAGDVDGDGYADVLVGAYLDEEGPADEGVVYLYRGRGRSLTTTPRWTATPGPSALAFGESVAFAGDVNGDGRSDVLVGDPLASSGQGRADLYLGADTGPDTSPDWTALGPHVGSDWARVVASARDVNRDGYDDVLLGAPLATSVMQEEGIVAWFPGGPTGLAASPAWQATGAEIGASLGAAIAGLGDISGDGYPDVAAGVPDQNGPIALSGAVRVWEGSAAGPAGSPVILWGTQTGARFGASLAAAGDVNGDGLADLIVGEPFASAGQLEEGRAHVFLGTSSGFTASPDWTAEGNQADAHFGSFVAPAGDVDADGYDDVLVVADGWDGAFADAGAAFLYRGGPAGPELTPAFTYSAPAANASLDRAGPAGDTDGDGRDDVAIGISRWNGAGILRGRVLVFAGADSGGVAPTPVFDLEGDVNGARLGSALDGRGDVDGDGRPDLIVGARGTPTGGRTYLFAPPASRGSLLRQRRADDSAPVAFGGRTPSGGFLARGSAFTVAGRIPVRWELQLAEGESWTAFGGAGAWSDSQTASDFAESVSLASDVRVRWRARVRSRAPWFPGRWQSPFAATGTRFHLVTPGAVGVPAVLAPADPFRLTAAPVPFRGATRLSFVWPRREHARVTVHDVAGRRVATLADSPLDAGPHRLRWDGRDSSGREVAAGVYWARVESERHVESIRLVRLR